MQVPTLGQLTQEQQQQRGLAPNPIEVPRRALLRAGGILRKPQQRTSHDHNRHYAGNLPSFHDGPPDPLAAARRL
jgi:hypothetical protein